MFSETANAHANFHAPHLHPPHARQRRGRVVVCASSSARADEKLLIKNPGDHPRYFFDAEPHGLVGYGPFVRNFSACAGFRGTFILVQNGFVPTINNSIGLGVGADAFFPARGSVPFVVPVVMQWNFWLSTHWSVFGEPGVAVAFGSRDT